MIYVNEMVKKQTCPICGTVFYIKSWQDWQWNIGDNKRYLKNVCSYSCMRKWESERSLEKRTKKIKMKNRISEEMVIDILSDYVEGGKTIKFICEKYDVCAHTVYGILDSNNIERRHRKVEKKHLQRKSVRNADAK